MVLGFFLAEAYHNKPDKVLSGFIVDKKQETDPHLPYSQAIEGDLE